MSESPAPEQVQEELLLRDTQEGIQALAEDRETFIEPKGILADLAQSLNRASTLYCNNTYA